MAHPRRFRFGVDLQQPFDGRSWLDTVREVEALGYSTLFVPDHFDEGIGPITDTKDIAAAFKRGIEIVKKGEPVVIDTITQPR